MLQKMPTCRLCLYKGDEKQVLSVWDNEIEDLPNKINNCVAINITINDSLPTFTCLSCIHQITQWSIFKETCQKSQEILRKTELSQENNTQSINKSDKLEEPSDYKNNSLNQINEIEQSETLYECDVCKELFTDHDDYLHHQETHEKTVFACKQCSKVFDNRKSLTDHNKKHKIACKQCGKLIQKASMRLHLIKHSDRYKCTSCSGRFNCQATLDQHIITVHTDEKNHVCDICGKSFSSPQCLRVHKRTHSEERPYNCTHCTYSSRTASALNAHNFTHTDDTRICDVCAKTFKSLRNLRSHQKRIHAAERKLECVHCNRRFLYKWALRVHLRSHTGVRPYLCKICAKGFVRSDALKEHMIIHEKRSTHTCNRCNKNFMTKRSVLRHNCLESSPANLS